MFWVYGKPDCPFCEKAVEYLKNRGEKVAYIDVTNIPNTAGWKTVPQVFTESKYIGGYEELIEYEVSQ